MTIAVASLRARGVIVLAGAVLSLGVGCRDATGPRREQRGLVFSLTMEAPITPTVVAGLGYVDVAGRFALPCQPYPINAAAVVNDSTVALYVTGQPPEVTGGTTPSCTPGSPAAEQGYSARVGRLGARPYLVQVIHRWPGDPWVNTVVLTDTVAVP